MGLQPYLKNRSVENILGEVIFQEYKWLHSKQAVEKPHFALRRAFTSQTNEITRLKVDLPLLNMQHFTIRNKFTQGSHRSYSVAWTSQVKSKWLKWFESTV